MDVTVSNRYNMLSRLTQAFTAVTVDLLTNRLWRTGNERRNKEAKNSL